MIQKNALGYQKHSFYLAELQTSKLHASNGSLKTFRDLKILTLQA
jgi:hypothetical protein